MILDERHRDEIRTEEEKTEKTRVNQVLAEKLPGREGVLWQQAAEEAKFEIEKNF